MERNVEADLKIWYNGTRYRFVYGRKDHVTVRRPAVAGDSLLDHRRMRDGIDQSGKGCLRQLDG